MQDQIQGFQLSPQQKRLWLLQQNNQVYRSQCAILLEGNLKIEVLKAALQQIVDCHEILRTTFHRTHGIKLPIQVIANDGYPSIREIDLGTQPNGIENLWQQVSQKPIDWENGSLLQVVLARLSSSQHVLLIHLPSLCADAITLENLRREIGHRYAACLQGKAFKNEPLQYVDFSDWQNELLESEETEAGRDYWRKLDISSLTTLKLPVTYQSQGKEEFSPQVLGFPVSPELAEKIKLFAEYSQTSVSAFFLTCWQILLWQLTETSNIVVGTACDGRNYEELKDAFGLLVKYLPLYVHLEAANQFSEVLTQVEESLANVYGKQQYFSWEQIATPDEDHQALVCFPFCFEFESRLDQHCAGNISFSLYRQCTYIERFQVKLSCTRQGAALMAEFHYDGNLFRAEDIQRLAGQFETLLDSAIENPQSTIVQFNILPPYDRQRLLAEFNNTQTAALPYLCLHHWFEKQAQLTPDRLAVVSRNQQLTYQELNERANQLAHYLQKQGVQPEIIVGICVERSIEMVVGVLGILKAGGAYLPLDPAYPKERLAFILSDTQTPLLLTQQQLLEILPNHRKVLCLDIESQQFTQESRHNPASEIGSDNLAYVIYTSGSTGKPKGTLIPHHGLVNYLSWCTQAYAVEEGNGTIVHSSLAFDLTITGLFSPLLVGSQVELLAEDFSIESLMSALRQSSNLSLVKITPAQLRLLSQQLSPSDTAGRTNAFIIGGENLVADQLAFWQTYAPETVLVNEYGPTETVVGCCVYQVPLGKLPSGSVPIGRPIANTQLYVLNSHLQPVPTGVAGELYIGGAGVARGYLNRPELTAERFIPNPFGPDPGARLYKTGDLACFRADDNLEFLGRIDHQVKVRGFRIELGEIEAVLVRHPGVREAVVMVREDVPGDQRLVAYVVPMTEAALTAGQLRTALKAELPEYMIPSAFVLIDILPLTINGKVDRQALPAPDSDRPELEAVYQAPQTELEQAIAAIWQEVLHLDKVGIHDNFFDLGGYSLLMVQVHNKLQEVFNWNLSIIEMFQKPTISSLAEYLNQNLEEQYSFQPIYDRAHRQIEAIKRKKHL